MTFDGLVRLPSTDMFDSFLLEFTYFIFLFLFERSEFLIATCKKKKTDRLCGCVSGCSANLGFSVEKLSWLQCRVRIMCQPVQQYKHHVVRSIARSDVSPGGARSDGHHWCQAARTAATCT